MEGVVQGQGIKVGEQRMSGRKHGVSERHAEREGKPFDYC